MDKVSPLNVPTHWILILAVAAVASSAALKAVIKSNRRAVANPRDTSDGGGKYGQLSPTLGDAGRAITIAKPKTEVFDVLCNAQNWPSVIKGLRAVEALGGQRWRLQVGKALSSVDIKITENRDLGQIAWQSDGDGHVGVKGCINLRESRDGQGTELSAELVWRPPGGSVGQPFVRLLSPAHVHREMQQLKMRLESGEMARMNRGLRLVHGRH